MSDTKWNDLEITSEPMVMVASRQFAEAFSETTQFREFERSYSDYRNDEQAQTAIRDFQKKQASLKALLMLNAVSEEDRQELERLQDQFYHQPTYLKLIKAQQDLLALSQDIGDFLSKTIGMDFGSSCRTGGCCG